LAREGSFATLARHSRFACGDDRITAARHEMQPTRLPLQKKIRPDCSSMTVAAGVPPAVVSRMPIQCQKFL
jgi:hypothetical protein